MTNVDEAAVREWLFSERTRLQNDIYERTEGSEAVLSSSPLLDPTNTSSDQTDDADSIAAADRNQAIVHNSQLVLVEVNAAIERLAAGTYGICVRCGLPINSRRLEALPYVTLCINCQNQVEAKISG